MFAGIVIGFVVVFALILLAVSVGLKFFDARRKKQMANMLQTAGGESVTTITILLKGFAADKRTGAFSFRRLVMVATDSPPAVCSMLATITSLLKEIAPDKPTGFKQLLSALQFTEHAEELLQQ